MTRKANKEAVANGADLVAGYGGDGTQLEVANGLVSSAVPMAILPGGTGNAMAFELDVPRDLAQAAALIVNSANRRTIDLGSIGDRVFMLRAYTGVQAEERASREMKDKYGNLAYVAEGLKFAAHPPEAQYRATIDGEVVEGKGMICYIFNAGTFGGLDLPEIVDVDVSDGLLDLKVITHGVKPIRAAAHYVLKEGNGFANEMGTPDKLRPALELLCTDHKVRHVDVVQMEDGYFIQRLYVGIEPEQQTSRESKDKYGTFAYAIDSYHRARDVKEVNYQINIDGEDFEFMAAKIYVVNAAKAGTGISITGNISKVDDGLVDIFLLSSKDIKTLSGAVDRVLHLNTKNARESMRQAKEIFIDTDPDQPVWTDGEYTSRTPISLKVLPGALPVIVPID